MFKDDDRVWNDGREQKGERKIKSLWDKGKKLILFNKNVLCMIFFFFCILEHSISSQNLHCGKCVTESKSQTRLGFFVFQVHLENVANNFSPQGLKQKRVQTFAEVSTLRLFRLSYIFLG